MGHLPILKPSEVISILNKLNFTETRQRGSHKQFRHVDGRDVSPLLLRQIAKDIGMTVEDFISYR